MREKQKAYWLTPSEGVMRRSLAVLAIAAGIAAALVASSHIHSVRADHPAALGA